MNTSIHSFIFAVVVLSCLLSCKYGGPIQDPDEDDPRWALVGDWTFQETSMVDSWFLLYDSTGTSGADHNVTSSVNWITNDGSVSFGRNLNELIIQYSEDSKPFKVSVSFDLISYGEVSCIDDCERAGSTDWTGGCYPSWTIGEFYYTHFLRGSCTYGFTPQISTTVVTGEKNN